MIDSERSRSSCGMAKALTLVHPSCRTVLVRKIDGLEKVEATGYVGQRRGKSGLTLSVPVTE